MFSLEDYVIPPQPEAVIKARVDSGLEKGEEILVTLQNFVLSPKLAFARFSESLNAESS